MLKFREILSSEVFIDLISQIVLFATNISFLSLVSQHGLVEEFGKTAISLTISLLATGSLIQGPAHAVLKYFPYSGTNSEKLSSTIVGIRYFGSLTPKIVALALLVGGIAQIFLDIHGGVWLLATALLALTTSTQVYLNSILMVANKIRLVSLTRPLEALARLTVFVVPVDFVFNKTLFAYLVSSLMLALLLALIVLHITSGYSKRYQDFLKVSEIHTFEELKNFSKTWNRSYPFIWLYNASDRWLLMLLSGSAAAGEYSLLYQILYTPISILSNRILYLSMPAFFSSGKYPFQLQTRAIKSLLPKFLNLRSAILVLVATYSIVVCHLIEPSTHPGGAALAIFSCLSLVVASLLTNYSNYVCLPLMKSERISVLMKVWIFYPVCGIIMNIPFIMLYGVKGAIFSLLITSCIYTTITLVVRHLSESN